MTEPTTPLPESPYCRVRARVASIWADGPDAGTSPDWRPAVGEKVTLTPSIGAQLLVYDVAGPEPIIVTVERVQCEVDADGWLVKPDGRPVYIAPTDDPRLSATGWTWTATIKGKSIPFPAPAGGVVNLALYIDDLAVDATERISVVQIVADYIAANPPDVEQAVADWLTANPPAAAPDATTADKGLVRLAGDLAGTADAPTVPGLADKADTSHGHAISDVSGLQTALDGKQAAGSYAPATHSHAEYAAAEHRHDAADIDNLPSAPDLSGFATVDALAAIEAAIPSLDGLVADDDPRLSDPRTPTAHGHALGDVEGLADALDGKQSAGSYAAASHTHGVTDLTATGTRDATTYLRGDNTWATPAGGGGGVTDHGALTGLDDDDHSLYALADGTRGAFAAPLGADDNYVTAAEKAALHSHANKTALDAVSGVNTGDQDLSGYATTTALTAGLSDKADAAHTHAPADIAGTAVISTDPRLSDARTPTAHSHAIADVTGLQTALDGKQAAGSYAPATHSHAAAQISDSTATGRSVLTAADAAAARTAIGAGTSNLALGTTASTAKAGNYAPPSASTTVQGVVELATTAEATTGTDTTRAVTPAGVKAVADTKANASHSHTAAQVTGLATVATSGAYGDLTGKPSIPGSPGDIGAAPATQPINAQTGTAYTLAASDAGKLVTVTAAAGVTVTVPASRFTAGQRVDVLDLGAGRVTFVAGAGMTLGGTPSLVSRAQYSAHSVVFLSASQAVVVGDLGAA